ncbi:MAG: hypothetical protein WCF85_09760 [Rhodospirillaceae bacterium]
MLKKLLTLPLVILAALLILFEDFVWDKVTALAARLARLRLVARLEARVQQCGPRTTLALFAVPIICLIPVKLAALYFISTGHIISGIIVVLTAKVTGTAISARLFVIAKPKLMVFTTFVTVYTTALRFNKWAHDVLERVGVSAAVRRTKSALREIKQRLGIVSGRNILIDRLRAARRRRRRQPD